MEGPEWDAQAHGIVHPGNGAKETAISIRGGEGGLCQGFHLLWALSRYGDILQKPGGGDLGGGRRLDGCGEELVLGKEVLDQDVAHPRQGGSDAAGV